MGWIWKGIQAMDMERYIAIKDYLLEKYNYNI